ncbi:MAG: hypothetical protein WCA39_08805, partial [Nitrososphaeraceae archaeon]
MVFNGSEYHVKPCNVENWCKNGPTNTRITASTVSIDWNQAKVVATSLFSIPGDIMSFSIGQ